MSAWSSADVIANGIRLHYARTGGSKPPIVMAHGFAANGLSWTRTMLPHRVRWRRSTTS